MKMKWKQRNKQIIKERNQRKNKTNKLIKTTEKHEEELQTNKWEKHDRINKQNKHEKIIEKKHMMGVKIFDDFWSFLEVLEFVCVRFWGYWRNKM